MSFLIWKAKKKFAILKQKLADVERQETQRKTECNDICMNDIIVGVIKVLMIFFIGAVILSSMSEDLSVPAGSMYYQTYTSIQNVWETSICIIPVIILLAAASTIIGIVRNNR